MGSAASATPFATASGRTAGVACNVEIRSETRLRSAESPVESGGGAGFEADVGIVVGWESGCEVLEEICMAWDEER